MSQKKPIDLARIDSRNATSPTPTAGDIRPAAPAIIDAGIIPDDIIDNGIIGGESIEAARIIDGRIGESDMATEIDPGIAPIAGINGALIGGATAGEEAAAAGEAPVAGARGATAERPECFIRDGGIASPIAIAGVGSQTIGGAHD